MCQDVQMPFLVIQVSGSHIIVIIVDGKSISLGHGKRCLKGLKGSLPIRLSLHIRLLLAVNPAEGTDVLNHFILVGIYESFNFFSVFHIKSPPSAKASPRYYILQIMDWLLLLNIPT